MSLTKQQKIAQNGLIFSFLIICLMIFVIFAYTALTPSKVQKDPVEEDITIHGTDLKIFYE
jgi:hypothetical protein